MPVLFSITRYRWRAVSGSEGAQERGTHTEENFSLHRLTAMVYLTVVSASQKYRREDNFLFRA